MEDRLADVEIKLNLAEDHLEELNRTVYRQEQQIKLLQDQLRELHRQMAAASAPSAAEGRNLNDEVPPHY